MMQIINNINRIAGVKSTSKKPSTPVLYTKRTFASLTLRHRSSHTRFTLPSTVFIPSRSMMTLRKLHFGISLAKKASPKLFIRHPSLVAQGTVIENKDYQDIKKILYLHNRYLANIDLSQNFDLQLIALYKNLFHINPKILQHILSIAYPAARFSLLDLQRLFPQINISSEPNTLHVTEDVVMATIAASVMKKNSIFKSGCLTVLANNYNPKNKKETAEITAFIQTKQKHPDYYYIYKLLNKNTGIWQRYYDFKSGKFNINTGHIICFSNKIEYEKQIAAHLTAQHKLYKNMAIIDDEYKRVLSDKNLTWPERTLHLQEFFRDNLQFFPKINPSFILYEPKLSEIDTYYLPKDFASYINGSSIANIENTQMIIAKTIFYGKKACQEAYMNHQGSCPKIIAMILNLGT